MGSLVFVEVGVVAFLGPPLIGAGSALISNNTITSGFKLGHYLGVSAALDSFDADPYSFPFRTYSLKLTSNVRLVLSVWRRCTGWQLR